MPTKIGLISDIHGNFDGLLRALDLLHDKGVEQILCAGDLVERGLAGDAVVRKIRDEAIPCVQGNHDRDAVFNQVWLLNNADLQRLDVMARRLEPATLNILRQLPNTLTFEWEGKRLLLAHGTPWDKDTYVFAKAARLITMRIFLAYDADIVILGHTHDPMAVQYGEKWIFNPGSLWENHYDGNKTCAILSLPDCKFEVFDIESGLPVKPAYVKLMP